MTSNSNKSLYKKIFFDALRIRKIEEKIIELYPFDKIQSPVHLSIGQESVAVSLCNNLNKKDVIFINYRGHSFYLAKGGPLNKFFAELYGKQTGISKGKAGSMHLSCKDKGVMGASAVVASTISHAVGFSLADKIRNNFKVVVSIFGDGATEQGVFHESLNFASLYKVPLIFLCENNKLAVHASLSERQSYKISSIVKSYKIEYFYIKNSFDLLNTFKKFQAIISNFRKNPRPIFIEVETFRYKEHVGPNDDFDAGYRTFSEFNQWLKKDPLYYDKALIKKFSKKIDNEIEIAIKFAENSNFPNSSELLKDVL